MTGPLDAKYIVKFTALTLFRRCIILCKLIVRIFARAALVGLCLAQTGCGSSEEGESAKVPHIGFMSMSASPPFIGALREGLSELGYVEGETIKIDWRLTDRRQELPGFAAEFVDLGIDVIIAGGTKAVQAAKEKTSTIPIVMTNSGDAVGTGLVASLARPGGNVTGSTQISPQLSGKRVELLKEIIPDLSRLAVLWHPDHPDTPLIFAEVKKAAPQFGLKVLSLEVRGPNPDFEGAFATAKRHGAEAMLVLRDPFTKKHQQKIVDLAAKNRIPAMYETKNYVDAGGLMLFGPSFKELYRHAATYTDKILKGANPAEMPVEHPTTFDLVINQNTAEAMGLTFPDSILLRATEVIR